MRFYSHTVPTTVEQHQHTVLVVSATLSLLLLLLTRNQNCSQTTDLKDSDFFFCTRHSVTDLHTDQLVVLVSAHVANGVQLKVCGQNSYL